MGAPLLALQVDCSLLELQEAVPLLGLQVGAPLLACLSTFVVHGLISAKLSDTGKQVTYDSFCCCCF